MASLLSYKRVVMHTLSTDFRKATRIVEIGSTPKAHRGTVIVKNYYVGINATDINITNGTYTSEPPPFGCGLEAVGVVIQVGEGVTDVNVNDAVAYRKLGAFAEYVEVEATALAKVLEPTPAVLPLIVCGASASLVLEQVGQMGTNETVLVTAAAGGTGQFAVQLAKLAGNHVIGTCSTDNKAAYLQPLGCDRVINYTKEDVAGVLKKEYPNGLNLVFESVGGDLLHAAVDNIALHGRIIAFGYISGYHKADRTTSSSTDGGDDNNEHEYHVSELAPKLLFRSASLRGFMSGHFREHYLSHMETLIDLVNTNELVAGVDPAKFKGLEQIPDTIDYMYARKNVGKIVAQLV